MAEARSFRYIKRRRDEGRCTVCGKMGKPIREKQSGRIIGRRRKCDKHLKAECAAKKAKTNGAVKKSEV